MKAGQIGLYGAVAFGLLSASAAWGAPVQRIDDSLGALPANARAFVAQDTTATMPKAKPHHHPAVVIHRKHHPHPMMRKRPASTTGAHPATTSTHH